MIPRSPQQAAAETYDLIVVGGGIYGCCLALRAAERGLRPLLLESQDFGHATSWSSLRILHGGLRYLQHADLARFRSSVRQRAWFCREFPRWTQMLPCALPVYNYRFRRRSTLRCALRFSDLLARHWVGDSPEPPGVSRSRMLDVQESRARFPMLPETYLGHRLQGVALWHDALMINPARILVEILHRAVAAGATCLNYVRAVGLIDHRRTVRGVVATDRLTGHGYEYRAPHVIDCTGPWVGTWYENPLAPANDLIWPAIAFNLVFHRPALNEAALAVAPPRSSAPTYFVLHRHGRLVAGTSYHSQTEVNGPPVVPEQQIAALVQDLAEIFPKLQLCLNDVREIEAGYLPASAPGRHQPARRPHILHHGNLQQLSGLVSVSGVKYTTACEVADRVLLSLWPKRKSTTGELISSDSLSPTSLDLTDWRPPAVSARGHFARSVQNLIRDESVHCWDDLVRRRSDWHHSADDPSSVAAALRRLLVESSLDVTLPDSVSPVGPEQLAAARS